MIPTPSLPALLLATAFALASLSTSVQAAPVVRPAPEFTVNTGKSLKAYRGQPVVVIVAPNARSSAFRKQVKRLERDYNKLAARKTLFVAAFTADDGSAIRSSIPFLAAQNSPALVQHYGAAPQFSLMVIGTDGNLDLITSKVSGSHRVLDAIINNATLQEAERRPL